MNTPPPFWPLRPPARLGAWLVAGLLAGCASVSPEADLAALNQLTAGKTAGVDAALAARDPEAVRAALAPLLAQPLSAEAAVRVALLNNPQLQAAVAALGISDAERVQASRLPNPHLALGRFTQGDQLEIERLLSFNVLGLLTLPWRAEWQGQQHALARLRTAQEVLRLAADTRKAWVRAVAAQQSVRYLADVKEAAEAGSELARRMARVGNWSRLQQAREQVFVAEATAQLARARHTAFSERERLTRLLGLWGADTGFTLPERLPELPATLAAQDDVEARALRERLDVRAAVDESAAVARSLGLVRVTGYVNALELQVEHSTEFDRTSGTRETRRGAEISLPLPLFDAGQARQARAQAQYRQAQARVAGVAVLARSEAREAYHGWRTAHDLAQHQRDELVPLRRFINDELLLRYNGMLASVWDLLADTRAQVLSVNAAIEAQRDFWLADTDLQTALTGTSPGALSALQASPADPATPQGH